MDRFPPPTPLPVPAPSAPSPLSCPPTPMAGTRVWTHPWPPALVPLLLALVALVPLAAPGCRAALVAPTATHGPPATREAGPAMGGRGGQRSEEEGRRSSPLRVAQCRARCLQRCWENCELLQSNYAVWGAMCMQRGICFPGCHQACKSHREEEEGGSGRGEASDLEPAAHPLGHQVVQVVSVVVPPGARGPSPALTVFVRCPSTYSHPPRANRVVYVVMTKEVDALFWTQVTQTADLEARLGASTSAGDRLGIRVLVVDPEGLVTIYSPSTSGNGGPPSAGPPAPISSPAPPGVVGESARGGDGDGSSRRARDGRWPVVIREDVTPPLGSEQLALLFPTASADAERAGQQLAAPSRAAGSPWVLREVSLIRQRVLVIAEVSWEARGGLYLVTWEVDGGGLKGNLFTQTTSVTLSLWPQTLYHVQVEVVSRTPGGDPQPPDRSQVLHLDTRRAAPDLERPAPPTPSAEPPPSALPRPSSSVQEFSARGGSRAGGRGWWAEGEVLAGSGAALALFFAVLLLLVARRWRGGRPCFRSPHSTLSSSGLPPLEGKEGGESEEGRRGGLFFFLWPLAEALAGASRGRRAKGDHPGLPQARPPSHIPTVSGDPPESRRHREHSQWLQHPESYADAFLREAERGAGNEVQV